MFYFQLCAVLLSCTDHITIVKVLFFVKLGMYYLKQHMRHICIEKSIGLTTSHNICTVRKISLHGTNVFFCFGGLQYGPPTRGSPLFWTKNLEMCGFGMSLFTEHGSQKYFTWYLHFFALQGFNMDHQLGDLPYFGPKILKHVVLG